jgi:hypothetical protein
VLPPLKKEQTLAIQTHPVHGTLHIATALVRAKDAAEIAHADTILAQVQELRDRALSILDKAEKVEDFRGALSAIREARGCLELLGKLAGELRDVPTVNILVTPAWLNIQTVILSALDVHPHARLAVADALAGIEVSYD